MRRLLIVAAAAGLMFLLAIVAHAVLTTVATGTGSTAAWAQATCNGCHGR